MEKYLSITNENGHRHIHFETDDPEMAEKVMRFIQEPHTYGMSDDLRKEMELILADSDLQKKTVDALKAKLDEARACLDKTRADRDILAQDLADVKGRLEAAEKLLCREIREHDHVAAESFDIVMGLLRAEGYNVESLINRTAAIYVLRNPLK